MSDLNIKPLDISTERNKQGFHPASTKEVGEIEYKLVDKDEFFGVTRRCTVYYYEADSGQEATICFPHRNVHVASPADSIGPKNLHI